MIEPPRRAREALSAELIRLKVMAGDPSLETISMRANQALSPREPKVNRQRVHDWIAGKSVPQQELQLLALAEALNDLAEARLQRDGHPISELRSPNRKWWIDTRNAATEETRTTAPPTSRDRANDEEPHVPHKDEKKSVAVSSRGPSPNIDDQQNPPVVVIGTDAEGRQSKNSARYASPKKRKTVVLAGSLVGALLLGSGISLAVSWQREPESIASQTSKGNVESSLNTGKPPQTSTATPPVIPPTPNPAGVPVNNDKTPSDPSQFDQPGNTSSESSSTRTTSASSRGPSKPQTSNVTSSTRPPKIETPEAPASPPLPQLPQPKQTSKSTKLSDGRTLEVQLSWTSTNTQNNWTQVKYRLSGSQPYSVNLALFESGKRVFFSARDNAKGGAWNSLNLGKSTKTQNSETFQVQVYANYRKPPNRLAVIEFRN